MRRLTRHGDRRRRRREPRSEDPVAGSGPGDPTWSFLWELGWGLVALLVLGFWMESRARQLDQEIQAVSVQSPTGPLARLTIPELHRRRAWDADLAARHREFLEPVNLSRVLFHLSRSLPEQSRIERLEASFPLQVPGGPAPESVVRVTAPDAASALDRLGPEPYLSETFGGARIGRAGGSSRPFVELTHRAASPSGPTAAVAGGIR